jgi:hypothetical protein
VLLWCTIFFKNNFYLKYIKIIFYFNILKKYINSILLSLKHIQTWMKCNYKTSMYSKGTQIIKCMVIKIYQSSNALTHDLIWISFFFLELIWILIT